MKTKTCDVPNILYVKNLYTTQEKDKGTLNTPKYEKLSPCISKILKILQKRWLHICYHEYKLRNVEVSDSKEEGVFSQEQCDKRITTYVTRNTFGEWSSEWNDIDIGCYYVCWYGISISMHRGKIQSCNRATQSLGRREKYHVLLENNERSLKLFEYWIVEILVSKEHPGDSLRDRPLRISAVECSEEWKSLRFAREDD